MLGSDASTMNCRPLFFEAKSRENTTARSAFWFRMSCSASCGVPAVAVIMKYSEAARRSMARWVRWSVCEVTTTVRTFFTSFVMAKPKSSISTTGIPKSMSIVRRSRTMWRASFFTNAAKGLGPRRLLLGIYFLFINIFIQYVFNLPTALPALPDM